MTLSTYRARTRIDDIVHIQSTYKVSDNDVMGICVVLANMIFVQNWIKENESDVESDDDTGFEEEDNGIPEDETQTPTIKRRKLHNNLTYIFPSRSTRRRWLRQGALLNLRYVADQIKGKDPNEVITLGFDDTTKAAGVRLYDVKTTNITIEKKSFTTGVSRNISHSGFD